MLPTLTLAPVQILHPQHHRDNPLILIKFHVFNGTELVGEISLEEINRNYRLIEISR
jgi:hypothetical protein